VADFCAAQWQVFSPALTQITWAVTSFDVSNFRAAGMILLHFERITGQTRHFLQRIFDKGQQHTLGEDA
jgi:hypothetical protein